MNIPAAIISAAIGAALFAGMNAFQYRPSLITPDYSLGMIFATKHSKARTAVTRLLIDPVSADFSALRSVEDDGAEYVCGTVRAKDKSGHYAEYRDFVYTVAVDLARIDDDDGRIAHRHAAFRRCPVSEEQDVALRKMPITPGTASMAKTIQTIMPTAGPSILSTMTPDMSAGGAKSSGGTLEQQVGQMASQLGSTGQPGRVGQGANSTFKAALGNQSEWRSEQPPATWPTFPLDHPLARPTQRRTTAQAMALAKDVEDRWEQSNSGASISRPSSDEIKEACRALLAIDPKDEAYPKAWAAFVRLRKIDRDRAS